VDTSLANGTTYYYVVSALNGNGEGANSSQVNVTPQPTTLPSPWMDQDVGVATEWDGDAGDVGWPGSAGYADGVYTVTGSGIDIWNSADSFHYVDRAVSGDCTIISRVASVQVTDPWAKGGVMIRETFNQDSANVMMLISAQNGSLLSYRPATAALSSSEGGAGSAPYWVRLTRTGNTFAGSISINGNTWQQVGSVTAPMATNVLLGLAVTAHNNATMNTATFDHVSITVVIPSAPTGLTASSNTAQVSLAWTAVPGATSYHIQRSSANGGPYTIVATVLATVNYTDTAIANGASYYYVVTAVNASGESLPSNQAAVSVPLPALAGVYAPGNNSLTLSWPLPASSFFLFSTPSLAAPVLWSPVTNALANQNGTITVTLPAGSVGGDRFFRLAAP
jgi:regulation of enolase protein 1 (concanavalin A-like superfamily)